MYSTVIERVPHKCTIHLSNPKVIQHLIKILWKLQTFAIFIKNDYLTNTCIYFLTFSPSLFIFLRFKVCANIIKKNFKRLLTLIDASLMLTDSYLLCVLYLVPIYRLRSITSIKRSIDDLLSKFLCALSIMDSINNIKIT